MIVSGDELEAIWQTLKSNLQTPYIASKCEIWSLKKLAIGEMMSIGVLKLIFNQGIIVVFLKSIDALRRFVKNKHFTVRLTVSVSPPIPLRSFFCDFFGVFYIVDYDSICSEADFTQEKVIFIQLLDSPFLRYESSTLILYKELSSSIFQSCQSVSEASVTPVQISTFCNI